MQRCRPQPGCRSLWLCGQPAKQSSGTRLPDGSNRTGTCRCWQTSGPTSSAGKCARGRFCDLLSSFGRRATPRTQMPSAHARTALRF
jgi:hypothetical protein